METKADPTYVPDSTHISSSEHGTFHFTRSNKRSTPSSRCQRSGTTSTGKHKMFPLNKDTLFGHKSLGKENRVYLVEGKLLSSITMTFIPTEDMQIVGLDLAAAAYVFLPHMNQEEVLVPTPHCHLTRKALRSLEPGHAVDDVVLTMLAIMLQRQSSEFHWFLPIRLVDIRTKRCAIPHDTVAFIRKEFMGKADRVYKIYCPIKCDDHWFLVIINTLKDELVYLDSFKSPTQRARRRRLMKDLVVFLEGLMDDAEWDGDKTKQPLLINDYKIIEPDVVQQDPDSNDTGIFVAQWMIMHYLRGTSDVERVSTYSRMRLAIDIVLKEHNADQLAFIDKAISYWRVFAPPPPNANYFILSPTTCSTLISYSNICLLHVAPFLIDAW
ncbi:hypothetical protein PIB30_026455 [Stylosanthes scabra]|uniref:Ubiquitin-like protease family profile domain-containing protein n=1 Tax=Stylosanthes scabra TaxID=79078 RepID=A0ABU6V9D1_9FABA|nr:hypothetical protein [Stylosanthes scabra]